MLERICTREASLDFFVGVLGFTLILFAVIELTLLAKRRLAAQK